MRKFLLLLVIFIIPLYVSSQSLEYIWGVWNFGSIKGAFLPTETDAGVYIRTSDFLAIEHARNGNAEIRYEGGYYTIKRTELLKEGILLYVETIAPVKDEVGDWQDKLISGVVVMHFINKDKVWFEVVFDSSTHGQFPVLHFPGKEKVYWRAMRYEASSDK